MVLIHTEYDLTQPSTISRLAALICVALVCVFCVQAAVAHIDRVEHALNIDHHASEVAGFVVGDHSHDDDEAPTDSPHAVSHAHVGDVSSSTMTSVYQVGRALKIASVVFLSRHASVHVGADQSVPRRPPKA
ncbi:MAG: hypothetical protein J0H51_20145 [Rhizobiales bacterium]|nr:hypothetical protein [Hyphomicrobiales bacterium]